MDFTDEWIVRAWRHEAGNHAQAVYAVEEVLEGDYDTTLPELESTEEIGFSDLESLSMALDERVGTYSEKDTMGLEAGSRARELKDITEGVLALGNGRDSIPVKEVTCALEHFGIETLDSNQEIYGNEAWRLPLHTIAKNSDKHGGPKTSTNEYLTEESYVVEIFDNSEGLEDELEMREIWEEGKTTSYGSSGFGLNMAKEIVSQLDGDIAAYTEQNDALMAFSPMENYAPNVEELEGVNYDDLGVGFVVEMPR